MKKEIASLVLALANLPAMAGNWKLTWSDEFDKPGLPDPAKWSYEEGFLRNNEAQYYTRRRSENARVEDGMLIIEARKERFPNASYDPAVQEKKASRRSREFAEYTSASLTTQGKASWTYGRIEVRAKLPAGRGTWPAIWTLGTNISQVGWPVCGEIDIMEFVGFDAGVIHANVHANNRERTQKTDKGSKISIPDASEAFHVYALEWDAKHMDFFVDDKKYFAFTKDDSGKYAWPFDSDQYLILNLAIGGGWGGTKGIDETCFPQRCYIDYVRVYQAGK
jgi:beta-glucanase (GH16 family)